MLIYSNEVQRTALSFIVDNKTIITAGLADNADFNRDEIESLDEAFHSSVVDVAYTLSDAAWVLDNCDNEEDDEGLWQGLSPQEAVKAQAAYSFANDVWTACEKIYNELLASVYPEALEGEEDEDDEAIGAFSDDETKPVWIAQTWDSFVREHTAIPVEPGSTEEAELLAEWMEKSTGAGAWGGYPLGESYIDIRCGAGFGMPHVLSYVNLDHDTAARLPHLAGKDWQAISEYAQANHAVGGSAPRM